MRMAEGCPWIEYWLPLEAVSCPSDPTRKVVSAPGLVITTQLLLFNPLLALGVIPPENVEVPLELVVPKIARVPLAVSY